MQVICNPFGRSAGIYFRTHEDLDVFVASPKVREAMTCAPPPDAFVYAGLKCVVATPEQWAAMEAMMDLRDLAAREPA